MEQPIELEFSYTDEDLRHIWTVMPRPNRRPITRKAILVVAPILIYQITSAGWTWVTAVLTAIVAVWTLDLVFGGRRPPLTPKRAADTPVRLRADREGFQFAKGKSDWSVRWEQCGEVHEGRDGFLISGKRPLYVPKRVLDERGVTDSFRELLKSKCAQFQDHREEPPQ